MIIGTSGLFCTWLLNLIWLHGKIQWVFITHLYCKADVSALHPNHCYLKRTWQRGIVFSWNDVFSVRSFKLLDFFSIEKGRIAKMNPFLPLNASNFMDFKTFQSVNMPLTLVSILMDIFFVCCMLFSQGQQRMKQPLNVLVGSLVGCNTTLHFCTLLFVISHFAYSLPILDRIVFHCITTQCLLFTMRTSVTSCLWLNVFYYCQIVPAQHPFLTLLKKNIRLFIYSTLIVDKVCFLFGLLVNVMHDCKGNKKMLHDVALMDSLLRLVCFLLSVFIMLSSSCATIFYLQRHMKSLKESSRFSPHLHSQMRVTITGIIQTVLYFLCLVWLVIDDIVYYVVRSNFDANAYVLCTVISLYSFGTNINLAVGQTIFREKIVLVLQELYKTICALLDWINKQNVFVCDWIVTYERDGLVLIQSRSFLYNLNILL